MIFVRIHLWYLWLPFCSALVNGCIREPVCKILLPFGLLLPPLTELSELFWFLFLNIFGVIYLRFSRPALRKYMLLVDSDRFTTCMSANEYTQQMKVNTWRPFVIRIKIKTYLFYYKLYCNWTFKWGKIVLIAELILQCYRRSWSRHKQWCTPIKWCTRNQTSDFE